MPFEAFLYGFAGAALLTPVVRRAAARFGVVDRPDGGRKHHAGTVPLLGGVAVFFALAAAAWLLRDKLLGGFLLAKHLAGILAGAGILVLGGALDDKYRLKPRVQLLFPAAAALVAIASGIGADAITNPFGGILRLDAWQIPVFERNGTPYHLTLPADLFTFAWLMGMTYTTKLLDGVDGVVAGLGAVGATVLALYSLMPDVGQPELGRLALALAGALTGFLLYNASPASIFLGEGGSTLVGYLLGVIAVIAGAKIGIMLMVVAVPVMDAAWTILRRLRGGKPLAVGDRDHLHHRLLDMGLSPSKTALLFWCFAAGFGGAGLFIQGRAKLLAFVLLAAAFLAVSFLIRFRRAYARRSDAH